MLKILNLFRVIWDGKNARDITQAWFSYNFFQLNLRMIFLHLIYANPRCCSVLGWSCSNWEVDQLGGQCVLCISTSFRMLRTLESWSKYFFGRFPPFYKAWQSSSSAWAIIVWDREVVLLFFLKLCWLVPVRSTLCSTWRSRMRLSINFSKILELEQILEMGL